MPVFNAEKTLIACIKSILSQTMTDWELIAINDFSEDGSETILSSFSNQDNRIIVHSNLEKGIIPALKLAYNNASGRIITRMDADDLMPAYKLQSLSDTLQLKGKGHLAVGKVSYFAFSKLGGGYINYQNWLNTLIDQNSHWSNIYKECVIPSACWAAYKDDLTRIDAFTDAQYPEDYDLAFRFYENGLKVIPISETLHFWRDHPERASRNDENYADQNFFPLKLSYFLKIDFNSNSTLCLWGAGKKGKALAKLLLNKQIKFQWFTNNKKKTGRDIYGIILKSTEKLKQLGPKQVITIIADQEFQKNKLNLYERFGLAEREVFEF